MKFVLAVCFYLLVSAITETVKEEGVPRIIGGSVCSSQDHRFVVSIRNNYKKHVCGGTLLNQDWVLTAAHCVVKSPTVYAGLNYMNGFRKYNAVRVVDMYSHPNFNGKTLDNDIALYRLDTPVADDGRFVRYVNLPSADSKGVAAQCRKALIMGWGVTDVIQNQLSVTLQCVDLPLIDNKQCSKLYMPNYLVTKNMICTLSEDEEDACQGDSGGPLVCHGRQIGIVSWGLDCAAGYPGVYTRIDKYLDFIEMTMKIPRARESKAPIFFAADPFVLILMPNFISNIFCNRSFTSS